MPVQPEMHLLQREIGSNQDLVPTRRPDHCTIVSNAGSHYGRTARPPANGRDPCQFSRDCGFALFPGHKTSILTTTRWRLSPAPEMRPDSKLRYCSNQPVIDPGADTR